MSESSQKRITLDNNSPVDNNTKEENPLPLLPSDTWFLIYQLLAPVDNYTLSLVDKRIRSITLLFADSPTASCILDKYTIIPSSLRRPQSACLCENLKMSMVYTWKLCSYYNVYMTSLTCIIGARNRHKPVMQWNARKNQIDLPVCCGHVLARRSPSSTTEKQSASCFDLINHANLWRIIRKLACNGDARPRLGEINEFHFELNWPLARAIDKPLDRPSSRLYGIVLQGVISRIPDISPFELRTGPIFNWERDILSGEVWNIIQDKVRFDKIIAPFLRLI